MLIEFKVGNFLSLKDIVTLSMVASPDKDLVESNTIPVDNKIKLIKSAVVYGANASGKTNLFKAMSFVKNFILKSSKESLSTEEIPIEKFRLSTETENEPSTFEIIFMIDKIRYRYGFQADNERVHSEWLFFIPTVREATLFIRENNKIKLGTHFKEGKGLEEKTRPNALFLSVADQFNGKISKKILKWFGDFNVISGIKEEGYRAFTISKLDDNEYRNFTTEFLRVADLDIKEIEIQSTPLKVGDLPDEIPEELKDILISEKALQIQITSIHQKYDKKNTPISDENFDFSKNESAGTQALFAFSAPIYNTLKNGGVLAIDELTSKLHPVLIRAIVKLFHSYNAGKNQANAQLVFASHDTNILSNQFFRRDQIWFTQKDQYGATDLYSLEEYHIRKDASFNKDYIMGKYGAIPLIGDIESLFSA